MVVLDRLHGVFAARGSQALRADLARARELLPDLGGRTYLQITAALGARERAAGGQRAGAPWLAPPGPSNTSPSSWPGCSAGRRTASATTASLDTFDELGVHFPDEFLTAPRITAARQTIATVGGELQGLTETLVSAIAAGDDGGIAAASLALITQCGRVGAAFPELVTALQAEGPTLPGITAGPDRRPRRRPAHEDRRPAARRPAAAVQAGRRRAGGLRRAGADLPSR